MSNIEIPLGLDIPVIVSDFVFLTEKQGLPLSTA